MIIPAFPAGRLLSEEAYAIKMLIAKSSSQLFLTVKKGICSKDFYAGSNIILFPVIALIADFYAYSIVSSVENKLNRWQDSISITN